MDVLVLWLDCDREGENICFEVCSSTRVVAPIDILMVKVMENAQPYMNHHGKYIFRAKFSGMISLVFSIPFLLFTNGACFRSDRSF